MKFFYTREKEDASEIFSTPTTLKNRNRSKIGSLLVFFIFGLAMFMPSNMKAQLPGFVDGNVTSNGQLDWEDVWKAQQTPPTATLPAGSITTGIIFDGKVPDSIYTGGGTKDHLPINGATASQSWQWKTADGSSSDKTNIQEAGAILIGGKIYFFGNKFAAEGTTTIGFWFFQDEVGAIANGRFSGEHQKGDILVVADIENGGAVGVIDAYKWVGDGEGTLPSSTKSMVKISTTNGTLGAIVNTNPEITPWTHQSKAPAAANTMPPVTFFEGFIDIAALTLNVNACFSSFLVETRSSNPVTSILEDFTGGAFNVQPKLDPIADITICAGDALGVLTAVVNGGIAPLTYVWTVPSGATNPGNMASFTPDKSGTYSVIVTGIGIGGLGTCPSDPVSANVTINPKPVATLSTTGVCLGSNSTFTAGPSGMTSYNFFADGNSNNIVDAGESRQNSASSSYTTGSALANGDVIKVFVTNSNGCTGVASASAIVNANPVATLATTGVCLGSNSTFTAGPSGMTSYNFFADGNSNNIVDAGESRQNSASSSYTTGSALANGDVIKVFVTNSNGCTGVASASAIVNANPTATLSTTGVCLGSNSTFTAGPSGMTSYNFFADGNSNNIVDAGESRQNSASSSYTTSSALANGDVIKVFVTNSNGCTGVASASAIVNANPTATLSTTGVCLGSNSTFTAGPSGMTSYNFFADGNSNNIVDAGESRQNSASSSYTTGSALANGDVIKVFVTNSNGCTGVASASAIVNANPTATLSTTGVCLGSNSTFTAGPSGMTSYNFFADGNSNNIVDAGESRQNSASSSYTTGSALANGDVIKVFVTNSNGCTGVASASAIVNANPTATLSTTGVCLGSNSTFTAGPSGMTSYNFFADGNSNNIVDAGESRQNSASSSYTTGSALANGDVIKVFVTNSNGCTGVASASAIVNANPNIVDAPVCVGQTVNMGIGAGNYSSSNLLVATVDANGVVSGISAGNATISYTNLNGCSDTATVTVQNCIVDEGCTPGYWKNHLGEWNLPVGYTYDSDFFVFFGISPVGTNVEDIIGTVDQNGDGKLTLLEAISAEVKTSKNNGWFAALARHAVAAYLNASNPDVGYQYSTTYILEQTELVFEGPIGPTEYRNRNEANAAAQTLHNAFRTANERVCPLGNETRSALTDTSLQKLADPVIEEESVVVADFSVSPVPFRESLSVRYDFDYISNATIQMFDLQGRLLFTQQEVNASKGKITDLSINFRILPSQIYVVKVTTDRDVFTKKIVSDK